MYYLDYLHSFIPEFPNNWYLHALAITRQQGNI